MGTERADIEVNMNGNRHGLSQMLREASKEVKEFAKEGAEEVGKSWSPGALVGGALGYLGFSELKEAFEGFIEKTKDIKNISEELGMGAEETERWAVAAKSAGFEMNKIANVLTVIQEKRFQAQNDPKVREQLNLLGISDQMIFNEKVTPGMIASQLGTEGKANEKLLMALLGPKGYRTLKGTLGKLPGTKSDLSQADIDEGAEMAELGETISRQAQNLVGRSGLGFKRFFTGGIFKQFAADFKARGPLAVLDPFGATAMFGGPKVGTASTGGGEAAAKQSPLEKSLSEEAAMHDAEKEASRQRQLEYDKKQEEHALKMHDLNAEQLEAERGLMTVGARRASIQKEIGDIQKEINELYDAPAEINGKNTEERIAKLKIQELHLRKQLIERPTEWQTKAAAFAAVGGTTFGGTAQHNAVVAELKNIHSTIKNNGTF